MFDNLLKLLNTYPALDLSKVSKTKIKRFGFFEEQEWAVLARNALMHKNIPLFHLAFKQAGKYENEFGDETLEIPVELKEKGWISYYHRQCFASNTQIQACLDIGKDHIHFADEKGECLHLQLGYIFQRIQNLYEIDFVLREMGPDFCCAIFERVCFDGEGNLILESVVPIYEVLLVNYNLYQYPQLIEWFSTRAPLPFGSLFALLNLFGDSNEKQYANTLRLAPIFVQHSLESNGLRELNYFQWEKEGIDVNPTPKDEKTLNQFLTYLVDHFILKGQFNVPFFAAPSHVLLFLLNDEHSGVTGLRNLQPLIIQYLLNHCLQLPDISADAVFDIIYTKTDKTWYCAPNMEHPYFLSEKNERASLIYGHPAFSVDMHAHLMYVYLDIFLKDDFVWNWFNQEPITRVLEDFFEKYTQQNHPMPEYGFFFDQLSSEIIPLIADWKKESEKTNMSEAHDFNYQVQRTVEHTYARIQYWHYLRNSNQLRLILEKFNIKHPGMYSIFYSSLLKTTLQQSTPSFQSLTAPPTAVNHERF